MNDKKIAVFICCNKEYVRYSITTLLTYKRFHPEWDYFVISEEVSQEALTKGIGSLAYDFSDVWNNEDSKRDLHCF